MNGSGGLSWIDYGVILLYLGGTLAVGLWIGKGLRSGKDYFLAGRALPWWAIGMSLVVSDIGATDIIGVGGQAYKHGLSVANFEWIGCVPAMIVGAFIFLPFLWKTGVTTLPEYMERRYNAGVRSAVALGWLLFMACNVGIMLFAAAKMLVGSFGVDLSGIGLGGSEVPVLILATAAFAGIYTLAGGLRAVVYTDVVQCAVMIGGCLVVLVIGLVEAGGIGGLAESLGARKGAEEHAELILPVDTKSPYPWTGIFFGLALILSPSYWLGNQAIIQRCLGAKSEFHAKASYIWGALLKNLIPFIIVIPGLIALTQFPELRDADMAIPSLTAALLPIGFKGIFLAAFIAALMSSVDSYLNASSAMLTNDLYKRFIRPDATEERMLQIGRWITGGLMLWGVLFALWAQTMEDTPIYEIFQSIMAVINGPTLAILLLGVLWKKATGMGALAGFLAGVATSVLLFTLNSVTVQSALNLEPLFDIASPFLYVGIWAFLVAGTVTVGVSLFRPEQGRKLEGLVYRRT